MRATVLYNPRCGTCQKVKAALEQRGVELELIDYLKMPPSVEFLDDVCRKLAVEPQAIAREKEESYASVAVHSKTRREWLQALHAHPELIQRPIVIIGERALIARPAEKLSDWL